MKRYRRHSGLSSSNTNETVALLSPKVEEEEEEEVSNLGASAMHMEDNDPKPTEKSEVGTMSHKLLPTPEKIIADIKHQLMREIRQFGRKYEKIFTLLEGVQGPLEVKRQLVEFAIKEAARFKRRHLIQHLEKFLEKIPSDNFPDSPKK